MVMWLWRGWTSCRCVDGLVGCVEGLLSGGASDRVVSSYEAERLRGHGRGRGSRGRGRAWVAGCLVDGLLSGGVWTNEQGSDAAIANTCGEVAWEQMRWRVNRLRDFNREARQL
jgi:hypothetical protein